MTTKTKSGTTTATTTAITKSDPILRGFGFVPPESPDILPAEAKRVQDEVPAVLVPQPGTNAYHFRRGEIPCETNPMTGKLARMRDEFHARATVTIGANGMEQRHSCERCQMNWHRFNRVSAGVLWGRTRAKAAADDVSS